MGQAISNIVTRICGEADQACTIDEPLLLSSSPSFVSFSELSNPQYPNPPTPPSPPPCKSSSSSSNGALKRTILDTCIDHSHNTRACIIDEQLLLRSSPSFVSFSELSNPQNPNPTTPPSPPPCKSSSSSSSSNGALKRTLSDTCIDHSHNTQACTIDERLLLSSSPSFVSFSELSNPQNPNPPTPPSPPPCKSSSSSNGALKRTLSDTCIDHSHNTQACIIDEQLLLSSSPSFVSFSELSNPPGPLNPVVEVDVEDEKTVASTAPPLSDLNSEYPIKENEEEREIWKNHYSSYQKILLVGEGERRINHYSSCQKILLVGEGDFSFSNSLAMAFGSATNMIATSLDSQEFLSRNYRKAMSNIRSLTSRGCIVMHGVDATEMANHLLLKGMTFDRIVYNFPHAGFFPHQSRQSELSMHRILVFRFLENAKKMMSEEGEIHISHKSNGFFREWNLEVLALVLGLRLIEELHFNFRDYPGYRTKYGFGGDKNFNCKPSKIYKFGLERN